MGGMTESQTTKVALVHDWLTGMRGGERCLEVFAELFPDAPIFTLVHRPGSCSETIEKRVIRTSFLQDIPFAPEHYRKFLPLFPRAVESFDLSGFDLILSSSHCAAKGVRRTARQRHVTYCYSPMRYMWDLYDDYFGRGRAGLLTRIGARAFRPYLRRWDRRSSARVDRFVAISRFVAERIERIYGQPSDVIYPPVETGRFRIGQPEDFFLTVSAFAPYKRVDLAIEAFRRMGRRLVVIGGGQDEERLKKMAGPNIEFLGRQPDAVIADYYARARAFIFPGIEDFGITPLESQAAGRPVIAFRLGGAAETVVPLTRAARDVRPTGLFFDEQTPESLINAVKRFEANEDVFDPLAARENALRFDTGVFRRTIGEYLVNLKWGFEPIT